MSTLLKLVSPLQEVGFDKWFKELQLAGYNNDWYDNETFFSKLGWQPSDMPEVTDAVPSSARKLLSRNRKNCYALIVKSCKGLEQHFEGVPIGDVSALYEKITQVYLRKSAAGYMDAQTTFTGSKMSVDHVNITEFKAFVLQRANKVDALGKGQGDDDTDRKVSESEKITVLLQGLLPEFHDKKTELGAKRIGQLRFDEVGADLVDYAVSEKLSDLKIGGSLHGADKVYALDASDRECKHFANHGTCPYDPNCKFSHKGTPGANRAPSRAETSQGRTDDRKVRRQRSRLVCGHCSIIGHAISDCFSFKNQGKSKYDSHSPATRVFLAEWPAPSQQTTSLLVPVSAKDALIAPQNPL